MMIKWKMMVVVITMIMKLMKNKGGEMMVIIIIFTTLVPVLYVCVCARVRLCMFCFLCPECTHNLTRLFNAYSASLHNFQSIILNDFLLFMLMPIFSSICVMYSSFCFCVNAGELMFVSCFESCNSG
jgi:hypothetical protein